MTGNIKCEILETFIEFPEIHGYHLELNLIEWETTNRSTISADGTKTVPG